MKEWYDDNGTVTKQSTIHSKIEVVSNETVKEILSDIHVCLSCQSVSPTAEQVTK